uniref:Tetratricopeptide repeat protein 19, mitochondrial n=1 Tax=Corvus moneduloides TaxID=1196302 RepID=A0A8C3E3C4_CORMO
PRGHRHRGAGAAALGTAGRRCAAPGTQHRAPSTLSPQGSPSSRGTKRRTLSAVKGELAQAEQLLHQALRRAQQEENRQAVIYTYSMVSSGAWAQLGVQLEGEGEAAEDDNAILEMSLKLASIYAAQNQHKLAVAGYQFCILTLEEKIAKEKDLPEDVLSAEEKANTRLLLGMSLDSYARYLLNISELPAAQKMYEKALQISNDVQGETHPQSVVLMNDLATVLDAQGHYEEALTYVRRAAELARDTQHPEEHMVLNNLAAILMHKEDFLQAKQVYKEALKQAKQKGDAASVQHIQEELAELAKRRKGSK